MSTRTDDDFLARFEAAELTPAEWSHEARLRATYLYLARDDFPGAVRRIRSGIRGLNEALGVAEDAADGYHETLTLAWARLVAAAMGPRETAGAFVAFIAAHPELRCEDRVLRHYSRERLLSSRARREFVLPDVAPFPRRRLAPVPGAWRAGATRPSPGAPLGRRVA